MDAPHPQSKPPTYNRGIVKQVLSGDAVVVRRAKAIGGPPPERQINFSNVIAPKVARRATASQAESKDEPFGWEAREFLRKKVIGKEVFFAIETSTSTGREYGTIFTGTDPARDLQSLTELMVAEGLLTVRRESIRGGESKLTALEDAAKAAGKGKWGSSAPSQVRNVKWVLDNPRSLLEKFSGKPKKAIIEHVRDGSTVRAFLLPEYNYITLMVSGIRCPMFKVDSDGRPDKYNAEPYAEEARYFVESRLLQRDVQIILESANNNNLVGSIKHPNGNIAELLLREGFAKCVDWSLATVTGGPEKLRKAERSAKQNQLKLWVDYKQPENQMGSKDNSINGKVLEIVNGDALVVRENNGKVRKIFLSSIRPPRSQDQENSSGTRQTGKNFRPLYDIPWLFEAREFLRKKLIGQKIKAVIDYVQPAQNNFPEKICCTVKIADLNVATAMVSKGYATVVKYRQDDDQRSSCYDDLLAAEAKAIKEAKGLHSKKDIPVHRVIDLSGDSVKAKSFFPFLQRAGKIDALVEFVASGSRMRLYIPRETHLVTFLLAGISCPRPTRPAPGGAGGTIPGEPFGADALEFTKLQVLQREIQIQVESMDKGGNYIGWLHVDDKNLSVLLVESGLSSVHFTAESSAYYHQLSTFEEMAKQKKLGIWANFVEPSKEEKVIPTVIERTEDYKLMRISEVSRDGHLFGQYCSEGTSLENMMERLRQEFDARPPVGGAYKPRKGEVCAAKFVDNCWYRAKIEKMSGGQVSIFYIDYGNREITNNTRMAVLPPEFGVNSLPAFAHEIRLACTKFSKDEDYMEDAILRLSQDLIDQEVKVNREYRDAGVSFSSVIKTSDKADVAKSLLSEGLLMLSERKEKYLQKLVSEYRTAQDEAKKQHLNIWRYGDATEDDAFEFGMER